MSQIRTPVPGNQSSNYLLKSTQYVLRQYSKRRNLLLRLSYAAIVFMIFNGGSDSKSQKNTHKQQHRRIQRSASSHGKKGFWRGLLERFKTSPLTLLLSQLNLQNPNTKPIVLHFVLQIVLSVVRAVISMKVASLDGYLVSFLITKRFKKFFKYLVFWILIGIPATFTQAMLTKTQMLLSKSIRFNLTNKILDDYLPDNGNSTVYQLINKAKDDGGESLEDPNQKITTVVEQFATSMSSLPSQLLKPTLDILLSANQLSKSGENVAEGALLLGLVTNVSALVLKIFTPNFSKLSSVNNELENKFHAYHSQVVQNNEEIALAKGHRREVDLLDMYYFELERFKRMELRRMAVYNFAVTFIFKYCLGAFGLLLCSLPIFTTAYANNFRISEKTASKISADFITNRRLLLTASESLGRLVQSKKTVHNLIGYGEQLWEFEKELIDINADASTIESAINNDQGNDALVKGPNVSYGDEVSFQHVPLVTPNGNTLVSDLTFSIKPGDNLLIIGPNGCGKSSLFRVLGGLWEVKPPGHLVVPEKRRDLFYLPQKSYLTYGSLREQIIYPHSVEEYRQNLESSFGTDQVVKNDNYLVELLRLVKLEHLIELSGVAAVTGADDDDDDYEELGSGGTIAESPLDVVERWPDLLSVGEQQRLALARLYYHQPRFAVLDECTSSISPDLEQECYRLATEEFGITVLSVCHRTSLWKFHSHILKFRVDGTESNGDSGEETEQSTRTSSDHDIPHGTALFTKFDPVLRLQRHEKLLEMDDQLKKSADLAKRLSVLKSARNRRKNKLLFIQEED